jgi:adenosylcobinamide-GDP ribazoletransferase
MRSTRTNPELVAAPARASGPRRAEAEIRAAIAFLTRIPVAPTTPTSTVTNRSPVDTPAAATMATGAAAFGLVGALVGVVGALAIVLLGGTASTAAGALAVAAMALVTGALHLDGLGDTADALAAPTPEAAELARVDPRLGAAGVVAVATVLIVDAALLGALIGRIGLLGAGLTCIGAASCARASAVVLAWSQRRSVRSGGAAWFAAHLTVADVVIAVTSAVVVGLGAAVLAGSAAVAIGAAVGSVAGGAVATWLARARRGLDGDVLGATVELSFAAILIATVLVP